MTTAAEALKQYGLRLTDSREAILCLFLEKDFALSQGDLETLLAGRFDRVTLYRTLKTFLEQGLVHKVLDDGGTLKYALCRDACRRTDHVHHHDHVHFKCRNCGQTTCIDNLHIPAVALPSGYTREETSLLVQGLCPGCTAGP